MHSPVKRNTRSNIALLMVFLLVLINTVVLSWAISCHWKYSSFFRINTDLFAKDNVIPWRHTLIFLCSFYKLLLLKWQHFSERFRALVVFQAHLLNKIQPGRGENLQTASMISHDGTAQFEEKNIPLYNNFSKAHALYKSELETSRMKISWRCG